MLTIYTIPAIPFRNNRTMPALSVPPESGWNSNVYILTTTRVFGMFGLAYLIRTLYSMVPSMWGAGSASVAAGGLSFHPNLQSRSRSAKRPELTCFCHLVVVANSFDLADIIPGTPSTVPGAVGAGSDLEDVIPDTSFTVPGAIGADSDLEANLTLEVRDPQPTYGPQTYTERSWVYAQAQYPNAETSGHSAAGETMLGQEATLHNGEQYIEEGADITVGLVPHNAILHSAAEEESGSMAAQIPADAIHPSLDT